MRKAVITAHAMQRAIERIGPRAKEIGIPPPRFPLWLEGMATHALNAPDHEVQRVWTTPTHQRVSYGEFCLIFDGSRTITVYLEPRKRRKGEVILKHLEEGRNKQ
jgi:hypothetical protein